MSLSNKNNSCTTVIDLGSPSVDTLFPGAYAAERMQIESVHLINGANIAASDTNFVVLQVKNGSTIIAEIDTRAAHENGLTINVAKALNLVAAETLVAAGSTLTVNYDETDAGTNVALTNAVISINWYRT